MSVEFGEVRVPEREGVIFLIYKDGKVLIENRVHPNKVYYGYPIIPGGKVKKDEGEPYYIAAQREAEEECGIVVRKMVHLDTFLHVTMSNHLYRTAAYLITDYEGEVKNVEGVSEQIWVDIEKVDETLPFADSKYVVKLARDYLMQENS